MIRARFTILLALFCCGLTAGGFVASAAELRTTVKYVSLSTVYLDAGRSDGVETGDTVRIFHGDSLIMVLEVSFVADNSASCNLPSGIDGIQIGDGAVIQVKEVLEAEALPPEIAAETAPPEPVAAKRTKPDSRINRLSGRIGLDYTFQDDLEEFNYDYTQPSLRVRATLDRIGGSYYRLSLRMRARKTYRDRETSSSTQSSSSSRIYEAALLYDNPDVNLSYGAGRLLARELRGIGYIDGAFARYRLNSKVSTGLFGGTEPDLDNTDFQTDVMKAGAFVSYENRMNAGRRLAGTLSLAGSYNEGTVSREFVYQQISYHHGARFSLYESTELSIFRDWLKDAEGTSLKLSSLLLNARYAPARAVAFNIGYDNRSNFYTYESRSIPDSLFDDALREGWRGSIDLKLTRREFAEIGGSLRTTEGDRKDTRSGWLRLGTTDLASTRIGITAQVRTYESEYSKGYQPSLRVARSLIDELRAAFEVGANNYDLELTGDTVQQHWLRLMLDASIGRHLYGSLDAEAARGSGRDANIVTLGLGYRL